MKLKVATFFFLASLILAWMIDDLFIAKIFEGLSIFLGLFVIKLMTNINSGKYEKGTLV